MASWLYLDRPTDELWWGGEPDGSEVAEVLGGWELPEADQELILEVWERTCPARRQGTYCYAHHATGQPRAYRPQPRLRALIALAGALERKGR